MAAYRGSPRTLPPVTPNKRTPGPAVGRPEDRRRHADPGSMAKAEIVFEMDPGSPAGVTEAYWGCCWCCYSSIQTVERSYQSFGGLTKPLTLGATKIGCRSSTNGTKAASSMISLLISA